MKIYELVLLALVKQFGQVNIKSLVIDRDKVTVIFSHRKAIDYPHIKTCFKTCKFSVTKKNTFFKREKTEVHLISITC